MCKCLTNEITRTSVTGFDCASFFRKRSNLNEFASRCNVSSRRGGLKSQNLFHHPGPKRPSILISCDTLLFIPFIARFNQRISNRNESSKGTFVTSCVYVTSCFVSNNYYCFFACVSSFHFGLHSFQSVPFSLCRPKSLQF